MRSLFFALLVLCATATPALAATTLTLSANPGTYLPGETVVVTVEITSNIADGLQAIGFRMWMPEDVTATEFITAPNSGIIDPQYAEGAWYNLASPLTASLEITIGAEVTGNLIITGQPLWMDGDDQQVQYGELVQLSIAPYVPLHRHHSADTDADMSISLSELLRVIQLYNIRSYSCDPTGQSEDGYVPGGNDYNCATHGADTDQNWSISLSELLRMIQFYNVGSYHHCPDDPSSEDSFCPGTL